MATLRVFTDADIQLIQGMLDRERRQLTNPRGRPYFEQESQSPEVYVARAPAATAGTTPDAAGGIPAMVGAVPGFARCDVMQLLRTTPPSILSAAPEVDVYNISYDSVPASAFGVVTRDKYGTWVWLRTISQTSSTIGFTGCKPVLNGCTSVLEYWHFEDGALITVDSDECEECRPTTGTGTRTIDNDCPCPNAQGPYCVTLSGLTEGSCSYCAAIFNRTFTLQRVGPCHFAYSFNHTCSDVAGAFTWTFTVTLYYSSFTNRWTLSFNIPDGTLQTYQLPEGWNCSDATAATSSRTDGLDSYLFCQNWPATAIVRLCSDTGTGTDAPTPGTGTTSEGVLTTCCGVVPVPTTLTLSVVSGCGTVTSPRTMTYRTVAGVGTWETEIESLAPSFTNTYWILSCLGSGLWRLSQFCGGGVPLGNEHDFTSLSCSPFDSGDINMALVDGTCCGGSITVTVRITE